MSALAVFSPAKLNLMLAITGRRADGYHDLVSVVAPTTWGDTLHAEPAGTFTLECDDAAVPRDNTNLILKAADAFVAATGWTGGARFRLEKRIPVGAGLGGGSSNAVAALRALNQVAGNPLDAVVLRSIAVSLGSDCALFCHEGPVVMRGRGEQVDLLPASAAARLRGRKVLILKPAFGISTKWAYRRLAEGAPGSYLEPDAAEARLASWLGDTAGRTDAVASAHPPAELLLFNNLEAVAFPKFPALTLMLQQLSSQFGVAVRMSGSGSACFALLHEDTPVGSMCAAIRAAWGESVFAVQTQLA